MIEVEVKLPVEDIEKIKADLIKQGYESNEAVEETDFYYTSSFYDFWAKDEALRIRQSTDLNTGKTESYVTYKGAKMDAISMTRKELETGIADGAVLDEILSIIGFKKVLPVKKQRHTYCKEGVTVCLDQVEGLGNFMEVEVLVEEELQKPQALIQIEEILRSLGYRMEDTTRKSYLSQLLNLE